MTRTYELIYALKPSIGDDAIEAEVARIKGLIEAQAEIVDEDIWGRRRLAYEIQDETEGYYVLMHFNAEPDFPKEIERLLRISDNVLRYLVVRPED